MYSKSGIRGSGSPGDRRPLCALPATLIEYENDSGLLWWDGVPIGRLVDSGLGVGTVKEHVARLNRAFVAEAERFNRELAERYG